MATQFPTNVVVLPRPTPTTADLNRAAEAFALSLECAAAGDIAGEEAALRAALDAVPDDPSANINYGNRLYNSGRFQEALACYNTAVGSATTNVVALFNRGNALEELGFFAEAAADWTAAVTLAPDFGDPYPNVEDADYGTWEKALDVGRSYLVGATVPRSEFQRVYTSSLNEWQRLAYEWCMANPSRMLVLTSTKRRLIYHIAKRGEYVEFGLPHHCQGREKYRVSRNGKTKVLINVD